MLTENLVLLCSTSNWVWACQAIRHDQSCPNSIDALCCHILFNRPIWVPFVWWFNPIRHSHQLWPKCWFCNWFLAQHFGPFKLCFSCDAGVPFAQLLLKSQHRWTPLPQEASSSHRQQEICDPHSGTSSLQLHCCYSSPRYLVLLSVFGVNICSVPCLHLPWFYCFEVIYISHNLIPFPFHWTNNCKTNKQTRLSQIFPIFITTGMPPVDQQEGTKL